MITVVGLMKDRVSSLKICGEPASSSLSLRWSTMRRLPRNAGKKTLPSVLLELADVLEVLYALCEAQGHSVDELRKVYEKKHAERGGFSKRILLLGKE